MYSIRFIQPIVIIYVNSIKGFLFQKEQQRQRTYNVNTEARSWIIVAVEKH